MARWEIHLKPKQPTNSAEKYVKQIPHISFSVSRTLERREEDIETETERGRKREAERVEILVEIKRKKAEKEIEGRR